MKWIATAEQKPADDMQYIVWTHQGWELARWFMGQWCFYKDYLNKQVVHVTHWLEIKSPTEDQEEGEEVQQMYEEIHELYRKFCHTYLDFKRKYAEETIEKVIGEICLGEKTYQMLESGRVRIC